MISAEEYGEPVRTQQRFSLANMNNLAAEGGWDDGVGTTTRLSQIHLESS